MAHFCLPDSPNPERAASKVEQNLQKLEKCSTADSKFGPRCAEVEQNLQNLEKCSIADSKFGPRGSESRTKSRKIEKIFYR